MVFFDAKPDLNLGIRRLPVYLLIDCSGSMAGTKIIAVNEGLELLYRTMASDPRVIETEYVSLITFSDNAMQEPLTDVPNLIAPTLAAHGTSAMGSAIHLLCDSIRHDLVPSGTIRKGDYRPLVFLFTDGQPTDDWKSASRDLHSLTKQLQPTMYCFGFGYDVNPDVLLELTDNVFLLSNLTPHGIAACLGWISSCISMLLTTFSSPINPSMPLQMPSPIGLSGLVHAQKSTVAREHELAAAEAANTESGKPPYMGVRLSSSAEVKWILLKHNWSGELYSFESSADLRGVILNGLDLSGIHLARADLTGARLAGAVLVGADFLDAQLTGADLVEADCSQADLSNADLTGAKLEKTNLSEAKLEGANLSNARLIGANAKGADLKVAGLQGTLLRNVNLSGANLRECVMDRNTRLIDPVLDSFTLLGDIQLTDTTLTRINWQQIPRLGDENIARQWRYQSLVTTAGQNKPSHADRRKHRLVQESHRLELYQAAVRANRQLAVALQHQGMNEDAARFAYRAQVLQRGVYRLRGLRSWGRWLFSGFLDGLAGYGYKPERSILWYLVAILGFASAYFTVTHGINLFGISLQSGLSPLQWYEALVLSISSFHGRGFFQPVRSLGDPVAILAAAEAIIGLLIEISFIATFTQRFFGSK